MRVMTTLRHFALGLLAACPPLFAQAVWNMGAPWLDLDQVIAMAAPGDVVQLNGLQFAPFTMNKGLTLIGPGTILPFTSVPINQVTRFAVPAGELAHVVDVTFTPHPVFGFLTNGVEATGAVTFEGCSFGPSNPASLVVDGTVLLHHCTIAGSAVSGGSDAVGGMRVLSGICGIVDCTLLGASAVFSGSYASYIVPPSPALSVFGGTVLVSSSNLFGGAGMAHPMFGAPLRGQPAVIVTAGALSLSDCSLAGGGSPPQLPGPVALVGNAATFHGRTTLTGGTGSTTGAPTSGPVQHLPQLVGMRISAQFRLGSTTTLTATSGSSQPLGMVASFDPTPSTHPAVIDPIFGPLGQLVPLFQTMPANGQQIPHVVGVPNQPHLLGVALQVQAYQLDGTFVRMSAAAGGVVH